MNNIINEKQDLLIPIFQSHKIKEVFSFGSVNTPRFKVDSDIDLLISFQDGLAPLEKGELWWSLYDTLRTIFGREVDLISESSLKNPYFIQELNRTKQRIYG